MHLKVTTEKFIQKHIKILIYFYSFKMQVSILCPTLAPRGHLRCPETFSDVIIRVGCYWIEARDASKLLAVNRAGLPKQRTVWYKMSKC